MKKIVKLTESDLTRIIKRVISEQTSDMMSFEKVVDVPNTNKTDLFNLLKGNRELMRNGTLRSEIDGQQLDIQKKVPFDKLMYKLVGMNPLSLCYYGTLTFDVLILVKDNKYKIVCDNFVWSNYGSGCKINHELLITKTKPKGMTLVSYWNNISKILPKYVENYLNQIKLTNTQSDF